MEGEVIITLNFNLTKNTPLSLLNSCSHEMQPKNLAFTKYILELSLLNGYIISHYGLRTVCACAVRLAETVLGNCGWSTLLTNLV